MYIVVRSGRGPTQPTLSTGGLGGRGGRGGRMRVVEGAGVNRETGEGEYGE